MSDFETTMSRFSPDNRLTFQQYVVMAQRMRERHQVSDMRAMRIVEETLQKRQANLDERAKASGGKPWDAIRKDPEASGYWQSWMTPPDPNAAPVRP